MNEPFYHVHPSLVFKVADLVAHGKLPLQQLEIHAIKCVLSKAIYKLSIIQQLLPRPFKIWSNHYQPMVVRMTRLQRIAPPDSIEDERTSVLTLVQKSRYYLQHVLEEVVQELGFQGTQYYLEFILCCETVQKYAEILLKDENIDYNRIIVKLEKKMVDVRETFQQTSAYLSDMIECCLEKAVVKAWVEAETIMRQTEFSEKARIDQNTYRLREKELALHESILKCNENTKEENVISLEIENHLLLLTVNLQRQIDSWTKQYNEEIDSLDVMLLQLNSKRDDQKEKYEKLLDAFTERQELVEVMQAEADERERELEEKRKRDRAARMIQLWWRGILFTKFIKKRIALRKKRSQPILTSKPKKAKKK